MTTTEKIKDRVAALTLVLAMDMLQVPEEEKQRLDYNGDSPRIKHSVATDSLKLMVEAVNKIHEEETGDNRKPIYYPWFWKDKPGVGFSFLVFDDGLVASSVASRLCLREPWLVEDCAKHPEFLKFYKPHHLD